MPKILHKQINLDGTTSLVFPNGETQMLVVATGKSPWIYKTILVPKDKLKETMEKIYNGEKVNGK